MALPAGLGTGVGVERLGLGVEVAGAGGRVAVGVLVAVALGCILGVGLAFTWTVAVGERRVAVDAEVTAFTVGSRGSVGLGARVTVAGMVVEVAVADTVSTTGLLAKTGAVADAISWISPMADAGVELA